MPIPLVNNIWTFITSNNNSNWPSDCLEEASAPARPPAAPPCKRRPATWWEKTIIHQYYYFKKLFKINFNCFNNY
jgi:hypothetical protein